MKETARAPAGGAVEGQDSAVHFDRFLADRKAEAGALVKPDLLQRDLNERLEGQIHLLSGHAYTR